MAGEVESEWMMPLLIEEERNRLLSVTSKERAMPQGDVMRSNRNSLSFFNPFNPFNQAEILIKDEIA